jgi:phosphoserine phosphatase
MNIIQKSHVTTSDNIEAFRTASFPRSLEFVGSSLLSQTFASLPLAAGYGEVTAEQFLGTVEALEVVDRARLLSQRVAPIMLADLDGTLIRDASGIAIAEEYVAQGLVLPMLLPAIERLLPLFGSEYRGEDPNAGTRKLIDSYERWVVEDKHSDPEALQKTREIYGFLAYIYAGRTEAWVQEFAKATFDKQNFWDGVFTESKPLVKVLNRLGVAVAIISASPDPVARVVAAHLGVPARLVRGVPIAVDSQGQYLAGLSGPLPFREGKVQHAQDLLLQEFGSSELQPLIAIGDTPAKTDSKMIEMARLALVAEPQTKRDYLRAAELEREGHAVVVVDFRSTVDGKFAGRFDLRGESFQDTTLKVV